MNFDPATTGFAVMCDERGIIQKIIRDDMGVTGLALGQPVGQFVDSSSRTKLLNFLVELRGKGAAFDWEVNISQQNQIQTYRLAGAVDEDGLLIVGASTPQRALNLLHELMKINDEQANALRMAVKDQTQTVRAQRESESIYDEISRLNNELVTLQRDLAKKNAELERLNAEMTRLAVTDSLTGVYNRRGFFEIGAREIDRARRFCRPLSVIMFDLDHFKEINDTYGHPAGDEVLRLVVTRCQQNLRSNVDVIGRYGGDEFTVLLPESTLENARSVAGRLLNAARNPLVLGDVQLDITFSLGVAELDQETGDFEQLLQRADRALYLAKESGRNCVRTA